MTRPGPACFRHRHDGILDSAAGLDSLLDFEVSIPGLSDIPGPVGDVAGAYGDWWKTVDGATIDGMGT